MKKLTLALAVAVLSLSTSAFADETAIASAQGEINFTGVVTESGCVITPPGVNGSIDLGSAPKTALTDGKLGPVGSGQIRLTGCDSQVANKTVNLTVRTGNSLEGNAKAWKNDAGKAENVGILVRIAGQDVPPTGLVEPISANIVNGVGIYPVQGQMIGFGKDVTAGSVRTTLIFDVTYD